MPSDSHTGGDALIAAVGAAAERLASRLRRRQATRAEVSDCSPQVPAWWRQGLAGAAIFGDGLASLPPAEPDRFSRPVAFLRAAEISMVAGGEYLPVAWLDGGAAVALVHDRGERPVVAVGLDELHGPPGSPAPLADSLVAFLDALEPQTVCRLAGPGGEVAIELCGDLSLLIEDHGGIRRRDFDTAEEMGEYVAHFLDEAIEAGMRLRFCSARLRPLIQDRAALAQARLEAAPELRAQATIQRLLDAGQLELRDLGDDDEENETLEDLIDDAARFLERNARARHLARRFGDWLSQHPSVVDVYADDDTVQVALDAADLGAARLLEAVRRAGGEGQA